MKRALAVLALAAFVTAPAAAQWLGMPSWNSPKGGGVEISADYGQPNADYGQPNAIARKGTGYGARLSLGVGTGTLTAGASSWQPATFSTRVTSFGGSLGLRLFGGSLLPVAVNLQLGGAYNNKVTSGTQTLPEATTAQGAVGLS